MNIFSTDSKFYMFMTRTMELFVLNILFLVCCIPVFTIGAAASAFYTILLKIVRNESGYIAREYFNAFRSNFRQSTILWLILGGIGALFYFDLRVSNVVEGSLGYALRTLFWLFIFIWGCVVSYAFPLIARFQNTAFKVMKNAFWMAFGYLPWTVSILVIKSLPGFLIYFNPSLFWKLLPLFLTIGVALQGLGCAAILNHVFQNYMPKEDLSK